MMEQINSNLPEYSDTMYLQGYSANQVYRSFKNTLNENLNADMDDTDESGNHNILITIVSEVK